LDFFLGANLFLKQFFLNKMLKFGFFQKKYTLFLVHFFNKYYLFCGIFSLKKRQKTASFNLDTVFLIILWGMFFQQNQKNALAGLEKLPHFCNVK
jgi:hypothetical protein